MSPVNVHISLMKTWLWNVSLQGNSLNAKPILLQFDKIGCFEDLWEQARTISRVAEHILYPSSTTNLPKLKIVLEYSEYSGGTW